MEIHLHRTRCSSVRSDYISKLIHWILAMCRSVIRAVKLSSPTSPFLSPVFFFFLIGAAFETRKFIEHRWDSLTRCSNSRIIVYCFFTLCQNMPQLYLLKIKAVHQISWARGSHFVKVKRTIFTSSVPAVCVLLDFQTMRITESLNYEC